MPLPVRCRPVFLAILCAPAALPMVPGQALAQRASENAVANADDAFGTSLGFEQTGIYSEFDTRGFSPAKAGNARIEGIYYDPVQNLSSRIRQSTAIRVGFSAESFPFQAPTGIADYRFRPFPDELGVSQSFTLAPYNGVLFESDLRLPIVPGRIGLTGGFARADLHSTDRSSNTSWGLGLRPFFRFGGTEIVPFVSTAHFTRQYGHPLIVVRGSEVPDLPPARQRFFQRWSKGATTGLHYGTTVRSAITDNLSLRGGLFHASGPRKAAFSEIFTHIDGTPDADHRIVADPYQDVHSTSGEAMFALRLGEGRTSHRLLAGFRGRNRYTETGGSDVRSFGRVRLGDYVAREEPDFAFGPVNSGRVKQVSWMAGYSGRIEGVGSINLGVQKTRYRAANRDALSGTVSRERADPWLYNASLRADLSRAVSVYVATQRGLEDSGVAPENAANRNAQLPAALSTQYEGGVRWKFDDGKGTGGQLVAAAFQIEKPYFTFDGTGAFTQAGIVRHRGVEASLSGHFGKRFNVVAGAVAIQPRVLGAAATRNRRAAGTPSLYAKVDLNYRTDLLGGLTPTAGMTWIGKRAVGAAPAGGQQLMLPGHATFDIGARQQFTLGKVPASFRAVVQNVFDKGAWKVVAPNALIIDEGRRFTLSLAADF
ncbi:MAG TPA: TonB-dependent receptor [Novosphingobium sp.]|nr:TonB-dependent receptor [Novosphingobium sp.]